MKYSRQELRALKRGYWKARQQMADKGGFPMPEKKNMTNKLIQTISLLLVLIGCLGFFLATYPTLSRTDRLYPHLTILCDETVFMTGLLTAILLTKTRVDTFVKFVWIIMLLGAIVSFLKLLDISPVKGMLLMSLITLETLVVVALDKHPLKKHEAN